MGEENLCIMCQFNDAIEPHICPYKQDVYDDEDTLCTCCEDCIYECAMDI